MSEVVQICCSNISSDSKFTSDANVKALMHFLEMVEDELLVKKFYIHAPLIMKIMQDQYLKARNSNNTRTMEKVLYVIYLCLRCLSWADGLDNELVEGCLNGTFNKWMKLFLDDLQKSKSFELKRNILKCLTVIFRDFIHYSKECINLIL